MKLRRKLEDAAAACGIKPEVILEFISYEWISPADAENQVLDEEDIARARLIFELQQDFGVNNESIPVILHLIDQLHRLHQEIHFRKN